MEAAMVHSVTFTVHPTGRQFEAEITKNNLADFDKKYEEAHQEAAAVAAAYGCEAFVTVCGTIQKCRFHPREYRDPKSILRKVMALGRYRSYWNFTTSSWHPLPLDREADEGYIIAPRLLPPPKKPI